MSARSVGLREREGPKRGGAEVPCRPENVKHGGWRCQLRRSIPAAWGYDLEGEQRAKEEEMEGYL